MKPETKLGIGVLCLIAALLIVSPVSADTGNVVVLSELSPSFSMTVAAGNLNFPLSIVGTNEKLDGNLVTVNSNGAYKIWGKSDKAGGKMERFAGTLTGTFLTNPLEAGLNEHPFVPLSTTDQELFSSAAGSWSSPLKLRQLTVFADPPAQSPANYQCTITITGGSV